jgi:hypothetical protein
MIKETTVEFAKKHNYGGIVFFEGDKLTLPVEKAEALKAADVLKEHKKAAKKGDD